MSPKGAITRRAHSLNCNRPSLGEQREALTVTVCKLMHLDSLREREIITTALAIPLLEKWQPGSSSLREGEGAPAQPEKKPKAHPEFVKCTWIFHKRKCAAVQFSRKWDYQLCHFATSDVAKHRQGLSRLWGRDENFTTVMLVIHCGFTGKLYAAQHLGTFGEYGADCSLSVFPNGFGSQRFPYRSRLMRDSKPNVEVTNQREAHPKCSQHVKNSFHIFGFWFLKMWQLSVAPFQHPSSVRLSTKSCDSEASGFARSHDHVILKQLARL